MKRASFMKGAFVAACLATGSSFAHAPVISDVKPVLSELKGSSGDMRGSIEVHNPNEVELYAAASSFTSPLGYVVELPREATLVKPGETVRIPFFMSIRADGLYHVRIPVELRGVTGETIGRVEGTLDVQVREGTYYVDTFENLFVRPIDRHIDELGDEVYVFPAAPPPTSVPYSEDYRRERWEVEALEIISDEAIYDLRPGSEGDEVQSPTLPLPPPRDTTLPRHEDREDSLFTPESIQERIDRAIAAGGGTGALAPRSLTRETMGVYGLVSGMTATGSFHYTGLDGQLHPAWGWRVYAHVIIFGSKIAVAKTNVKPNGSWNLSIPTLPSGYKVEISYEPRNVYFTLRNVAGARYRFSSGGQHSTATNKVLNEYTQAAYLSNSDLVGLGEVHRDGMDFWEALKTKGEGIDPVRGSSISLYYPNTSYDCGDGSGNPWSCASAEGKIWIIPMHATGAVLMHELGHQLMYKYWNGERPDGAGGSHTITKCYTTGLALSEGFANFMQVYANLNRNQNPSANGFMNLENPQSTGACTTKNSNELWVAGNFWDFYDQLTDNKDSIYYWHTGATPKLFLKNGKHDSMAEYLPYFKAIASSNHQTIVGEIFTQNKQ